MEKTANENEALSDSQDISLEQSEEINTVNKLVYAKDKKLKLIPIKEEN